jgi:hypothetical protein
MSGVSQTFEARAIERPEPGHVAVVFTVLFLAGLVIPGALFLIPLTRFPGFVWLIAAGFGLSSARSVEP